MLDRHCCLGLQSVWSAAMEIQTENADIYDGDCERSPPDHQIKDCRPSG